MITKKCSRCKKNKSLLDDFYYRKSAKDKRQPYCKKCQCELDEFRRKDPKIKAAKAVRHRKYMREWRKDPHNRQASLIRNKNYLALVRMIRNFDGVNDETIKNIWGIGKQGFMNHLENLFEKGMSWKNYGAWHLDHKINLSDFNLLDPKVAKKANHYKNIRPMWATGDKGNLTRKKSPKVYH